MSSIIVEITAGLDQDVAMIELTQADPESLLEGTQKASFTCDVAPLPTWPGPDPVREYGQRLFARLSNPEVAKIADAVRTTFVNNGTVYLKFKADQWERHAWEALCKDNDFFLLQPDRGIARIVDPRQPQRSDYKIEPSLRVMAVLSAAGISGRSEWDALYRAAKNNAASGQGLPIELHVLTGEEELMDDINKAAQVKGLKIRCDPIASSQAPQLLTAIRTFRPHLLHFFCHGEVTKGVGVLRFADIDQHREGLRNKAFAESAQGSFVFDYSLLRMIAKDGRANNWLWLVVLNACKLGGGGENVSPLAQKLVAAGAPAAIGMTEEIDPIDAGEFSRNFYPEAFAEIGRINAALTSNADGLDIDWSKLLYWPRNGISATRTPASSHRHWTLPVLYLQSERFYFRKAQTELAGRFVDDLTPILINARAPENVIEAMRDSEPRS